MFFGRRIFPFILSLLFLSRAECVSSFAVAQVGRSVLTSREIIYSMMMEQALLNPNELKSIKYTTNSEDYKKALSQIVLELVLKNEAESFDVANVDPSDLKGSKTKIQETLGKNPQWKELEVSESEMEMALIRKRKADLFLRTKAESFAVRVTDEDAKKYYDKNRVRFGNLPFENFRENIKTVLFQEQSQQKMKDWFELLKKKHQVRWLKPLS